MNLEEMSMEELLVDHRKYNTFGIQKAVESEAEILRRDKEKEERIKELEKEFKELENVLVNTRNMYSDALANLRQQKEAAEARLKEAVDKIEKLKVCQSCGKVLPRDCNACIRLWEN